MSVNTSVFIRMRDVCLALGAASHYKQRLSRIQLQKFIYLMDVVVPIYEMLPPQKGHLTYKRGPYDASIQNAVDTLAFRGLITVSAVKVVHNGSILTDYELNDTGLSWLMKLTALDVFKERWNVALEIAFHVERLNWSRLIDLVYAEPTYATARNQGFGKQLHPYDGLQNSAAFVLSLLEHTTKGGVNEKRIDRSTLVDLFFRYLEQYALIQKSG